MSYKLWQLPPKSTRSKTLRMSIPSPWNPTTDPYDTRFLRSWHAYDSELDFEPHEEREGNATLGLVLILVVSTAFWTGVGFIVSHLLK